MNVGANGQTERVPGELVSGTYFQVLGVGAAVGRVITPDDDRERGGSPVAVLSYDYWRTRFGANPRVVGQTIIINKNTLTIIGVSQAGFDGVDIGYVPSVRVPVLMKAQMTPKRPGRPVAGGARPIADPAATVPAVVAAPGHRRRRAADRVRQRRQPADRAGDVAPEGDCRRRIVGQLLVESVMLAGIGGLFGLVIPSWTTRFLLGLLPTADTPHVISGSIDYRILAFNFALSLITGLVFGLVPALRSTKPNLAPALKDQVGAVVGGSGGVRLRKGLVVAQVTLSVLLLIGAGLFIRSLRNLRLLDLGLKTDNPWRSSPATCRPAERPGSTRCWR